MVVHCMYLEKIFKMSVLCLVCFIYCNLKTMVSRIHSEVQRFCQNNRFPTAKGFTIQECIPVGCVPSAHYRTKGVHLTETPLDRDPLTETPQTETHLNRDPWTETPLDRDPLGQRPPWIETPWTETSIDREIPGHVTCGACWDRDPALWKEFLTHACENITLPQLR